MTAAHSCCNTCHRQRRWAPFETTESGGMVMILKTALLLPSLLLLAATSKAEIAVAPVPVISKDWKLDACVASTTATLKAVSYRLEVAIDPDHLRPLEIRIVPSGAMTPSLLAATFALDKKTIYAFAPLIDGAVDELWNIPRGTLPLITYLKREAKLQMNLIDGAKGAKISFSLNGSTAALSALQKQCNAAQEFSADGFERAFLPAVVANVDPSRLQAADTAKLRDLVKTALAAFRSSNDTQSQLNALSNQYLAQITEFEQLTSNLDKLTHDTVVRLNRRRADAQANIDRSNVEIPQLKAQVASLEAALAPANQALAQAQSAIAPMYPMLKRYQDVVDDADSAVSAAQADVSRAQTYEAQTRTRLQDDIDGVNKAANAVAAVQNEINSLRNDIQNATNNVDQLRRVANDAQSRVQGFNKFSEIQRRLSSDSRLGSIESSLRDAQNRMADGQRHISDAEADRARFNGDLHNCQAVAGKDCSHELDLSNREFNSLQNTIRDLQSQRDNFRSTVEREVDNDYNQLIREHNDALTRVNDAQAQTNQIVSQFNQAQNSDLPQAQRNLSAWQNARAQADSDVRSAQSGTSTAQRNLANARSDLDTTEARRDQWMASSGYNQRAATLDADQATVDSIKSKLNSLDNGIASREKLIRDETQSLADTEVQMQNALASIKQKEDRSVEVQKLLVPYFQQRDALAALKAVSDKAFSDAQISFAGGLPQAVSVVTPIAAK
jgi:chromosome segregation ATPase